MLLPSTFYNNFECFVLIGTVLLILSYIQFPILAQNDTSTNSPLSLNAAKLIGAPPQIDGNLNEEAWKQVPVATDFMQFLPDEGKPASE